MPPALLAQAMASARASHGARDGQRRQHGVARAGHVEHLMRLGVDMVAAGVGEQSHALLRTGHEQGFQVQLGAQLLRPAGRIRNSSGPRPAAFPSGSASPAWRRGNANNHRPWGPPARGCPPRAPGPAAARHASARPWHSRKAPLRRGWADGGKSGIDAVQRGRFGMLLEIDRSSCCWRPSTRIFNVVCSVGSTISSPSMPASRASLRTLTPPVLAQHADQVTCPPRAATLRATLAARRGGLHGAPRAPQAPAPRARCVPLRRTSSGPASHRQPRAHGCARWFRREMSSFKFSRRRGA